MKAHTPKDQTLATRDDAPCFERAFRHGVQQGLIDQAAIDVIIQDAAKGTLQVTEYFGASPHLRANLEESRKKMVALASLYLEHATDGQLDQAVRLMQEKPFRSLSRGGSEMLKTLYAMPEDDHFSPPGMASEKEFLMHCLKTGMSVQKYRQTLKARERFSRDIRFATWLAEKTGTRVSVLADMHASAEAVIRTLLLTMAYGAKKVGSANFPDQAEIYKIFASIRKEWAFLGDVTCSKKFLEEIPEEFVDRARMMLSSMEHEDLPKIVDASISMEALFEQHVGYKYFFRLDPMATVSAYDKLVAEKWTSLTRGAKDDESILTLLLCVSAGMQAKTTLSASEARKVVAALREQGVQERAAPDLIEEAPHADRDSLSTLWQDFIEDARPYLLDKSDEKMKEALNYLADHCNIQRPKNK